MLREERCALCWAAANAQLHTQPKVASALALSPCIDCRQPARFYAWDEDCEAYVHFCEPCFDRAMAAGTVTEVD